MSDIDWLGDAPAAAPAPAAFTPPRLAIIDGEAVKPAARKIGENRTSDFRAVKPEPGTIPWQDAWLWARQYDQPEGGLPLLGEPEILTYRELQKRLPKPEGVFHLHLAAEFQNLSQRIYSNMDATMQIWAHLVGSHHWKDATGRELANAIARLDGARAQMITMLSAAKGG